MIILRVGAVCLLPLPLLLPSDLSTCLEQRKGDSNLLLLRLLNFLLALEEIAGVYHVKSKTISANQLHLQTTRSVRSKLQNIVPSLQV